MGVSNYIAMPKLPTVHNNVEALRYSLTGAASWNLPFRHCTVVHDPTNTEELMDPILESANAAKDTLLFYYAGHGTKGPNRGELRLTSTSSRPGASYTATLYDDIRDILLTSSAKRRIVILDCCYAGSALGIMSDPGEFLAEYALIEGTYLIAAAGETQVAKSDGENGFTAFTGELINLLRNGTQDANLALLDLDTIFKQLVQSLRSKSLPIPQRRVRNSPGSLALAWNRKWMEQQLSRYASGLIPSQSVKTADMVTSKELYFPPLADTLGANEKRAIEESTPTPATHTPQPISANESLHKPWPAILDAVKKYRRYTWILLSQNATLAHFSEDNIRLEFANRGSLDNFLSSDSESVLKRALSEKFGLECEVQSTLADSALTTEVQAAAQPLKPHKSHIDTLAVGDEIDHEQFGRGTVLSTKGKGGTAEATVDFGGGKPKRLLLRYAPFAKVERFD
ncbi:caspase family protein [Streptomyces sp. NRRL B-24085]|uniref:caspase family protein n=1 Tax=Streptomyces sp. NRRL B-24085 TaxID=1709476 RepID=UPI002D21EAAF|nr:caspase family protein [Streptomyces sp. NRRL B-24085]